MYLPRKLSPRNLYRRERSLLLQESPSLSAKFGRLKSLSVHLRFFDPKGVSKIGEIKCSYNLDAAKSVFGFDCPNKECVSGDFDLTEVLAAAVAARRTTVEGELTCKGWRDKNQINTVRCGNRLIYKMTLRFGAAKAKQKPSVAAA